MLFLLDIGSAIQEGDSECKSHQQTDWCQVGFFLIFYIHIYTFVRSVTPEAVGEILDFTSCWGQARYCWLLSSLKKSWVRPNYWWFWSKKSKVNLTSFHQSFITEVDCIGAFGYRNSVCKVDCSRSICSQRANQNSIDLYIVFVVLAS